MPSGWGRAKRRPDCRCSWCSRRSPSLGTAKALILAQMFFAGSSWGVINPLLFDFAPVRLRSVAVSLGLAVSSVGSTFLASQLVGLVSRSRRHPQSVVPGSPGLFRRRRPLVRARSPTAEPRRWRAGAAAARRRRSASRGPRDRWPRHERRTPTPEPVSFSQLPSSTSQGSSSHRLATG